MDPGYRLSVPDHELTDDYLAGEIAGRPAVATFINHADVYSAVPDKLVSGLLRVRDRDNNDACYIISRVRFAGKNKIRKLRRIDGDPRKSYWHSEGGKTPLERSKAGGYVQDLVQAIKGTGGRTERTGWRMKEYGLSTEEHGDSELVLCKVYHTRRDHSTPAASTSATPADLGVHAAYSDHGAINSKKRKADYREDSRPSARPRLTEERPPVALRPEPESAVARMNFQVPYAEIIKAAVPNAPDLEGYFKNMARKCWD